MKTLAQQIAEVQEKRSGAIAKMEALLEKASGESREFTNDEQAEFDAAESEVKRFDQQIKNLETLERNKAKAARPVVAEPSAPVAPGSTVPATAKPLREKGVGFTRMAIALGMSKRTGLSPIEYAQARWPNDPEVTHGLKGLVMSDLANVQTRAAVDPMSSDENAGAGGGSFLAATQTLTEEFIEMLRPETVVGRIPGLLRLDFDGAGKLTIPSQAGGAVAGYVGEGNSIRVSRLSLGSMDLTPSQMATIVPVTNTLLRRANPSVERMIRDDMVRAVAELLDISFLSSAAAGAAPAGILNGISATAALDQTAVGFGLAAIATGIQAMVTAMRSANVPMRNPVWIMNPVIREYLRFLRDGQDRFVFRAELDAGTFFGFPVVATNNLTTAFGVNNTTFIALIDAAEIIFAEDQQPVIDVSDQASIQSDTAPTSPPTAPYVSAFQQDMTFFRIRAAHTWRRRRDAAVRYATWVIAAP